MFRRFARLPLFAWPVMIFLAVVVATVPGTAVRALALVGLVLVYLGTVSQVMLTERNADAMAATAHRPLLDVDTARALVRELEYAQNGHPQAVDAERPAP